MFNSHPNLNLRNEAQLQRLVADAFREQGWELNRSVVRDRWEHRFQALKGVEEQKQNV